MSDAIRALAGLATAPNAVQPSSGGSAYGVGATSANATSTASGSSSLSSASLGLTGNDFLKLFLTELQNQDPTSPMDNTQMMSQMSQLTMIQTLQQMSSALDGSRLAQSAGLIGKKVTGFDESGDSITGNVDRVDQTTDGFWLVVGDNRISADSVSSVTTATPSTTNP